MQVGRTVGQFSRRGASLDWLKDHARALRSMAGQRRRARRGDRENVGEVPLSRFGRTLWKFTPLHVELVFIAICLRPIGLVEPVIFQFEQRLNLEMRLNWPRPGHARDESIGLVHKACAGTAGNDGAVNNGMIDIEKTEGPTAKGGDFALACNSPGIQRESNCQNSWEA